MGIFWLYTGNGNKPGWLCHQLEKLRRKAKLLNQNHHPHMPFHTSLLCPHLCNTFHLQSSLAYIDKTLLQHFQYCTVIRFSCQVPPCNLEAHSPLKVPDSQRWGVSTAGCPRHKWAVWKNKETNKNHLLILMFWRKCMSKTEKTGYKADFEFWFKMISVGPITFHKGKAAAKGELPQDSH